MDSSEVRLDVLYGCASTLEKIFERKWESKSSYEIKGSNQPFCPRRYYLTKRADSSVSMNVKSHIYMRIGTAVHEVIQEFLADSIEVYCKWECSICSSDIGYCWYSEHPKCCNQKMKYIEFAGIWPELGLMNIHADAIVKINGKPCVLEIKTTDKVISIPERGYKLQPNLYCNLLYPLLGTEIYIIMYVQRGNLERQYFPFYRDEELFSVQKYLYQVALWSDTSNELPCGICVETPNRWCPFKHTCFDMGSPDNGVEEVISIYNGNHVKF